MSNKQNGTNAAPGNTADDAGESVLASLKTEFETNHKGKTSAKRSAELVAAFKRANAGVDQAEKALESAKRAASDAAKAIIREVSGTSRVTIGGVVYSPMSRGENVFFRKESAGTLDLG